MNYGTISFGKVGTDETALEVPWMPASVALVKARLSECGNANFENDGDALANYAGFYCAELAGSDMFGLPPVEQVRPSDVYALACKYDITLETPDAPDAPDEADENPTATKGARS